MSLLKLLYYSNSAEKQNNVNARDHGATQASLFLNGVSVSKEILKFSDKIATAWSCVSICQCSTIANAKCTRRKKERKEEYLPTKRFI